jgi:hypothetical protein
MPLVTSIPGRMTVEVEAAAIVDRLYADSREGRRGSIDYRGDQERASASALVIGKLSGAAGIDPTVKEMFDAVRRDVFSGR